MKKFKIIYYNRFCCENQTFDVMAKDKADAKRIFYLKFNKEAYHDCIENVYEVKDEHFYAKEEVLNNFNFII